MYVLCASLYVGNGYQSTSCDCNLWEGRKIGDPGKGFALIAVVDMDEDKSTRLYLI